MQVDCAGCQRTLTERAAGIATCPRGDEVIETWFLCPACERWTVDVYLDRFMGEGHVHTRGPLPRAQGDEAVARIRRCPAPGDKWCDCEVHRAW